MGTDTEPCGELQLVIEVLNRFGVPVSAGGCELAASTRVEFALTAAVRQTTDARAAVGEVTMKLLAERRDAPSEEVDQLYQRIAEFEEQLRVATGQRRPEAPELDRLDQLLSQVDTAAVRWAGYCPACRGRGTAQFGSVVGCCAACDGRGRVER